MLACIDWLWIINKHKFSGMLCAPHHYKLPSAAPAWVHWISQDNLPFLRLSPYHPHTLAPCVWVSKDSQCHRDLVPPMICYLGYQITSNFVLQGYQITVSVSCRVCCEWPCLYRYMCVHASAESVDSFAAAVLCGSNGSWGKHKCCWGGSEGRSVWPGSFTGRREQALEWSCSRGLEGVSPVRREKLPGWYGKGKEKEFQDEGTRLCGSWREIVLCEGWFP